MLGEDTIKVIIIDDHPIVRAGMRAILESAPDVALLAEGSSGAEALALTAQHRPNVLVLDINLPDINGIQVVRRLHEQGVKTAVLALTVQNDPETIFGLLESGATGYVLKDDALESLLGAVRSAARGESWLSPAVASRVVQRAVRPAAPEPQAQQELIEPLTRRELEVLRLLAQGLDNHTIAERLVITPRTVQNHVSNIYGKLGLSSRSEAMVYAIRRGLVQFDDLDEGADGA